MKSTFASTFRASLVLTALAFATACGDDAPNDTVDRLGVGAQCTSSDQCLQPDPPCDAAVSGCFNQVCLTAFKGGYCGIAQCTSNAMCPEGSACVAHEDGNNYCFRQCDTKDDCNANRDPDNEANCSSSVTYVEASTTGKACVPSSSGL